MDFKEFALAKKMLLHDEGLKLVPYKCTGGHWTIGVGHKLKDPPAPDLRWTLNQALGVLGDDIETHWEEVRIVFGIAFLKSISTGRKLALLALMYTLGPKTLRTFKQTLPAIKEGRWGDAAAHLLQTKWAKDVDPHQREGLGRDDRIAQMLKTGEIHPDYLTTETS